MQPLIYDVAVSLDGYIAGPRGDLSAFRYEGPGVASCRARMRPYAAAIMGRGTYEAGYVYGLAAGETPFPGLRTLVFSSRLDLPGADVELTAEDPATAIARLKAEATGPICLCGGGALAGTLLQAGLIDRLRLRQTPVFIGGGIPLFSGTPLPRPVPTSAEVQQDGIVLQEFSLAALTAA